MMNFKRLGMVFALALLSWLGLLGYTNIVAVSQGGTGATTASAARTSLGVAIGTNVQAYDADLTTWAGLTPSAFFQTLVDDASAAAARDTLVHASAGSIACSSPCTPAAGVTALTVAGTTTVNLPALSTYADGQRLLIVCDSASSCPVTLDPSDSGTCDGGSAGAACSAITVQAHGTVGAIRTGASAWGSVQPGAVVVGRIVATILGGAYVAWGEMNISGTWTQVTSTVASSIAGDPDGLGATASGTALSWGTGSATIATNTATEAQYVGWPLSAFGSSLGLGTIHGASIVVKVDTISVTSASSADYSQFFGGLGTSDAFATNMQFVVGIRVNKDGLASSRTTQALTGTGSTGTADNTIRRVSLPFSTPLPSAALGYLRALTTGDADVNALNASGTVGVTGTPTHLFLAWGCQVNQKATTFTAPRVELYL